MLPYRTFALSALWALASGGALANPAPPVFRNAPQALGRAAGLSLVANLDYARGWYSTFSVTQGKATEIGRFRLGSSHLVYWGIAIDRSGLLYTSINGKSGTPCVACVEVLKPDGTLVARIQAPRLGPDEPAFGSPALDAAGRVYVPDGGQSATYFFSPTRNGFSGPTIIENGGQPTSVTASPNGAFVFIAGNCGFRTARIYTRTGPTFQAGNCFPVGTDEMTGCSADDAGDVASPYQDVRGLVTITKASGGAAQFSVPDSDASLGSVAFSRSAALLYAFDNHHNRVYGFARPRGGWLSGATPRLVTISTGFSNLDVATIPL